MARHAVPGGAGAGAPEAHRARFRAGARARARLGRRPTRPPRRPDRREPRRAGLRARPRGRREGGARALQRRRARLHDGREKSFVLARIEALEKKLAKNARGAFEAFSKRADAAFDREDYAGALAIWADAGPALGKDWKESVDLGRERARKAIEGKRDLDAALAGPGDAAKLAAALRAGDDLRGSPTWKKLEARALEERAKTRGSRRRAGEERVAAIRAELGAAAKGREDDLRERLAQAKKASAKRPIAFAGGAEVADLRESTFTLTAAKGAVSATFHYAQKPSLTADVLEIACRPGSAADLRELVELCLKFRLFDRAEKAARELEKVDADAARRLPSIPYLRRASRPLLGDWGKLERGGDEVVYDFAGADGPLVARDWSAEGEGVEVKAEVGRGFVVRGHDAFTAALKEVAFDGALEVEVAFPSSDSGAQPVVVVAFDPESGKGPRLILYFDQGRAKLVRRDADGRQQELTKWVGSPPLDKRVRLLVSPGGFVLQTGNDSAAAKGGIAFTRSRILLGGIGTSAAGAVTFPRVAVAGPIRRAWMRKAQAAYFDILYRELSDDLREPAPAAAREAERPLSADDAFGLAGVAPKDLDAYRAAWKAYRAGDRGLAPAYVGFDKVVRACPFHAGALYGRALAARAIELFDVRPPTTPEADLDSAVLLDPGFVEAFAFRGELRLLVGDKKGAEADLERALALAPDFAGVYRLRAKLAREAEDFERAREEFALAARLDPALKEARRDFLSVKQVLEGPPWEKEKTFRCETEHFRVATNISDARAKEVGALLEQARAAYAAVLGEPLRALGKKASCLVFDTDEGFYNYSALATGEGRDERALGFYSETWKQLLFFEDKDDPKGGKFREVLFHEGLHRYVDETVPGCGLWFNEGLAEVMAGELVAADGVLGGRLANLEEALEAGAAPSAAELLAMPPGIFRGKNVAVNYAASWAFVRYLLRGAPPESETARALRAYIAVLREGKRESEALKGTLLKLDLAALDAAWKKWAMGLRKG